LTSFDKIKGIADEWHTLHARVGAGVFANYDEFEIWWRAIGQKEGLALHVVIGRNESGALKALLPLVVRPRGPLKMLEWGGHDVFDYGDVLAENESEAKMIWAFVRAKGLYDIALIRDVRDRALSLPLLISSMKLCRKNRNYFLELPYHSGEDWLATQTHKFRSDLSRKLRKMEGFGTLSFHTWRKGNAVPSDVIDSLCKQKRAWAATRDLSSSFRNPNIEVFIKELAQNAANKGTLYLSWMSCGDVIVACHFGFFLKNTLFLYITTFNDSFNAYSPGIAMMVETIKTAIAMNAKELDFMRGDENYKRHFASGHRDLFDFVFGRSWKGKLLSALRRSEPQICYDDPGKELDFLFLWANKPLVRRIATLAILLLLLFPTFIGHGKPHVPLLSKGINLSSWFANAPRQPLTLKDFVQIKKLGFDFVRFPVNPEHLGFDLNHDVAMLTDIHFQHIDEAIKGLTDVGLTVILDIHPEQALVKHLEECDEAEERFVALWSILADHYKTYPKEKLVFELLNEPQYYFKNKRYNTLAARLVAAIRQTNPDRMIVVNSPAVLSSKPIDALKMLEILPDQNVIYAVHYYQPYIISHQGMSFGFDDKQIRYFRNVPYPSSHVNREHVLHALDPKADTYKAMRELDAYINEKWERDRIDSYFAPIARWENKNHTRVLVLEFGALRTHIAPESRYHWIRDVIRVMEKYDLGWAYWDYSDEFGIAKPIGNTITEDSGAVRFANQEDPNNERVVDPEAYDALGLIKPQ